MEWFFKILDFVYFLWFREVGVCFCYSLVDVFKIIFRLLLCCFFGLLGMSIDIMILCLVFIGFLLCGCEIISCLEFIVNVILFSFFMLWIFGLWVVILVRFFMLFLYGVLWVLILGFEYLLVFLFDIFDFSLFVVCFI